MGRPLDAALDEPVEPPDVPGLAGGDDPSLRAIVLSHPHQDHYGLIEQVAPSIPLYVGEAAAAILEAAAFFAPSGVRLAPAGFLEDRQSLIVGPFTITPYLVDHSAFDSYALSVEAGSRRLFYSGDFRAHGRKSSLVTHLCDRPPQDVNVLLLEGTHVRAGDEGRPGPAESEVELAMAEVMRSTPGLVAVFSATQNIDRLVTIYRACKRAARTLVIDLYTASIAAATGRNTIPQPGLPRLRIYVPNRQRIFVKQSGEFQRVDSIRGHRMFLDEVRANARDLVMLIQGSTLPELAQAECLADATAVWSLWPGYLDQPSGQRTVRLLDRHRVPLIHLHSSGHARVEDLQALASALAPARVVPIHSAAPERFEQLFARVERHADGEWWEV